MPRTNVVHQDGPNQIIHAADVNNIDLYLAQLSRGVYTAAEHGAVGDGVTDDRAALAATDAANAGAGVTVLGPTSGGYRVSSSMTFANPVQFAPGAKLSLDSGVTVTFNGPADFPLRQVFMGAGTVAFGPGSVACVRPEWWGAVRDGKSTADAALTSGTAILTSASNPWTAADVGKRVRLYQPVGQTLVGTTGLTIASYQSPGQVTLSATVSTGGTSLVASWGTDAAGHINNAITAAAYIAPVQLLACTQTAPYYCKDNLELKSGTILQGAGFDQTWLMSQNWQGWFIDLNFQNIQDFQLRDFSIMQVGTGSSQTGVHLSGNAGGGQVAATASYGALANIHVDGGTTGFMIGDGSHSIAASGCLVTNQQLWAGALGKGVWFSNGCYDIVWDGQVIENVDGDGLAIDAGHQVSAANTSIVVTGLTVRNWGRALASNAILLEGAQQCVVANFACDGVAPTFGTTGLFLQEDQNCIPTSYCEVGPGVLANLGATGVFVDGAQHNHVHDITIHNLGLVQSGSAVVLASFNGQNVGLTPHDTSDNLFDRLTVVQDAGVGTYTNAVYCSQSNTNTQRNRFRGCSWGSPTTLLTLAFSSPAVANPPTTGANANVLDNLDNDQTGDPFGLYFGANRDTRLYRSAAGLLRTPGQFQADGTATFDAATGGGTFGVNIKGADTQPALVIQNTVNANSSSPNIVLYDGQSPQQRLIYRKNGTALEITDNAGVAQIHLDTAKPSTARAFVGTRQTVAYAAGLTLDCTAYDCFYVSLSGNVTNLTLANPTDDQVIRLWLVQDATGGRTVAWPANVSFPGGVAPTLSAASKIDIVTLQYVTATTRWYQVALSQNL